MQFAVADNRWRQTSFHHHPQFGSMCAKDGKRGEVPPVKRGCLLDCSRVCVYVRVGVGVGGFQAILADWVFFLRLSSFNLCLCFHRCSCFLHFCFVISCLIVKPSCAFFLSFVFVPFWDATCWRIMEWDCFWVHLDCLVVCELGRRTPNQEIPTHSGVVLDMSQ